MCSSEQSVARFSDLESGERAAPQENEGTGTKISNRLCSRQMHVVSGNIVNGKAAYQDCAPLERRGPGHPHPEGSQGGVREAAVVLFCAERCN